MPESVRIEGARAVTEAIRAGRRRVLEVVLPPDAAGAGAALPDLADLVQRHAIPVLRRPGPVEARAEPFPEERIEDLLATGERCLVALDRVTDAGNLGSIARSALTAGFGGLLLEHRHSPPVGVGALRASAGAIEHLRVGRAPSLRRALVLARVEGYSVVVAEAGGRPVAGSFAAPGGVPERLVVVLGSEDRGVRPSISAVADLIVGIPLHGPVPSLGVAAAAAHLLHRIAEAREAG